MSILSFKRDRSPYGRLVKHKARLCAHGGMHQWGLNYWETYSPVVNWMSVSAMLVLSILREFHTNSLDFFLSYTQAGIKSEIFVELPIVLGFEGFQPR